MNDSRGYRYGIPLIAFATICSLTIVLVGSASQAKAGFLPKCIGQDALNDGISFIDIFLFCSDGFRLALMSLLAAVSVLAISAGGALLAKRPRGIAQNLAFALRALLAGLTVGILSLIGIYFSEFWGGQGKLNMAFVVGIPIVVSLMHFPDKRGLFMTIPIFAIGFICLVFVAVITGIPLD